MKRLIAFICVALAAAGMACRAGIVVDHTPDAQRGAVVAELPYQSYFLVGDDADKTLHCWFPNTEVEVLVTDSSTNQPLEIINEPMLGDYVSGFKIPGEDATLLIVRSGGREIHWLGLFRIDSNNNARLLAETEGPTPDNPYVDGQNYADMNVVEIADGVPAYVEINHPDGSVIALDFNGLPFEQ